MDYETSRQSYIEYVNKCRNIIKNSIYDRNDIDNLNLNGNEKDLDATIKKHRLKMIDIKLDHTMRMIEQIIQINSLLEINVELSLVTQLAILYHDIGRMRQSTWSNSFGDIVYQKKNQPYKNHGEDGLDIFNHEDFNIDEQYIPIIGETILHHQDHHTKPNLNHKYTSNLSQIDISKIATGKKELNNAEWEVASLIVQLVADIDKSDILYQHLSEDFDMIREYIYDYSLDSLEEISLNWGVSKEEIIEYNEIDSTHYEPRKLRIPIENMPLSKLEVPNYMKQMFYNNNWPELPVLVQDKHWHFISILWWRLSYFLNQITFSSTLANIEESKLLEQIYEKIPERFKPLVFEAFEYAKEIFVKKTLEVNKGKIYIYRKNKP